MIKFLLLFIYYIITLFLPLFLYCDDFTSDFRNDRSSTKKRKRLLNIEFMEFITNPRSHVLSSRTYKHTANPNV